MAAQRLGIGARIVDRHVEAAGRRGEVASRRQPIIRALDGGRITVSDVLY